MKKIIKKAFTLVELLVVIAILAILSGVSVVGYTSFKKQAAKKADSATVDDMNTFIKAYESMDSIDDYEEIYTALLNDEEFDVNKLTAQTKNARFGYNSSTHKMGLYNIQTGKVIYAPNANEGDGFGNDITLTADDATSLASKGSHLVVKDITLTEKLTYSHLGSISTLEDVYLNGEIEYTTNDSGNLYLEGNIVGDVTLNTPNAHVEQEGILDGTLTENKVSSSTLVIDGYVAFLTVGEGSVHVTEDGVVREITNTADLAIGSGNTFVNDGYIAYVQADVSNYNTLITNNGFIGAAYQHESEIATDYSLSMTVEIDDLEDLLKFAAMTNHKDSPYIKHNSSGSRESININYNLVTININNDIDVAKVDYIPIAAWDICSYVWSNDPETGVQYTEVNNAKMVDQGGIAAEDIYNNIHLKINGNNHVIKNLQRNLIGALGMGTSINDLELNFNFESDVNTSWICYYNMRGSIIKEEWDGRGSRLHVGLLCKSLDAEFSNVANKIDSDNITINNYKTSGKFYIRSNQTSGNIYYFGSQIIGYLRNSNFTCLTLSSLDNLNECNCDIKESYIGCETWTNSPSDGFGYLPYIADKN